MLSLRFADWGVVDFCFRFRYDRWNMKRAQQAIKVFSHESTQSKVVTSG